MTVAPVLALTVPNAHNAAALVIYSLLVVVAYVLARRYTRRALKRMERPRGTTADLDLYDLAFLSGGAQRMLQVAAFRLHESGLFTFKRGLLRTRLVPERRSSAESEETTLLERHLHTHSLALDRLATLSDPKLLSDTRPLFGHVETKLAIGGYRPTASERTSIQTRVASLFLIPLSLGAARVIYGVSHGNPVLYLVSLMVLTVILAGVTAARVGKITPLGNALLIGWQSRVRSEKSGSCAGSRFDLACLALALSGPSGLSAFLEYSYIQPGIQAVTPGNTGHTSASSGCGSTGCGSSGCGSTGCGSSGCGSGCGGGCGGGD